MKLKKIIMLLILALAWSIPVCADEVKSDNKDSARAWLNDKEEEPQPREEVPAVEDREDSERFKEMQKEMDQIHSESWDERIDR